MRYSITLSYNNEAEAIRLPVLPEKFEISTTGDSKSYDISKLGEINVIKGPKLSDISFDSFFPASWYPGASIEEREFFEPQYYIDKINDWWGKKHPIRIVLTGTNLNINLPVSIEKFALSEEGGAVGDVYYQISLKEYRFYAAHKMEVKKPTAKAGTTTKAKITAKKKPVRPDTRVKPKTYTVKAGDNLWKIAQKALGDGSKHKQLQTLNGITDSEAKKLPVGKVLKLPT
ncbi:LysM peptidoglycan-binding domain-containing protein [Paenibacillus puldeungensis]|uniref:LysM peptidoglycan-binding domain-containing protein n=1 Tax=Paenibacillus puldeungensis TaxID=696536 RepID=A0ABW3S4T6_9BACL